ncbi:MAG: peptidoglycan-binding protein [Actinobacteria bacterium]|nr:peptidoglycan-binding protein [Actinomycetota bacterium]
MTPVEYPKMATGNLWVRPSGAVAGGLALCVLATSLALSVVGAPPAAAYPFRRTLSSGSRGPDVRALQVRVSGWFSKANQTRLSLNGRFGARTVRAVSAFQRHYGLTVDGVAGASTFSALASLQDRNGSTEHFNWGEFVQNHNSACGSQANAYAGTFGGGKVPAKRVKRNVRRLMWRLEAVRAKGGSNGIGINSGFRSVKYNDCIGGAGLSQHLYGTAADNRMATVKNRRERKLAKHSQLSGIGCYASLSHNHFDLRVNNKDLAVARFWWWPQRDSQGRDLDSEGRPCFGEKARATAAGAGTTPTALAAVRSGMPGAGSLMPSAREVRAFELAGEPDDLNGGD